MTIEQAKKLKPGAVCRPPNGMYLEMKLLIGTFCCLLYTLFGSHCDYYHELRKIHTALGARDVAAIRGAFTVDKCRRIIWAIIDDGRAFFRQKMSEADFSDPDRYTFPTSLLSAIYDPVRFANVIERPFYPKAWMIAPENAQEGGNTRRAGTSGGGQGGGRWDPIVGGTAKGGDQWRRGSTKGRSGQQWGTGREGWRVDG